MPWFVSDAGMNAMGGHVPSTSLMTTVTAGTANGLGSWTPLHAAVPFPVFGVELFMGKTSWAVAATSTPALFDFGFGVSPNEVAIVSNVTFGGSVAFASWSFPIYIPVGSRVVMRLRSAIASKASTFAVRLFGGGQGVESAHAAVTYGAVTASSLGTALTLPTGINTKSAYTTITAATTSPARWMLIGIGAPPTTLATAADGLLDISMGAAAAEGIIIPDIPYGISVNEEINCAMSLLFPVSVPAGIRLAARYQSTAITSASQPNITLTGFS